MLPRLVTALTLVTIACSPARPAAPAPPPRIGGRVPSFVARDSDAHEHRLPHAGAGAGVVLFVFWSARCPCSAACEPSMAAIAQDYAARGVRVFAVASNADEPAEVVRAARRDRALPVPVLLDGDGRIARLLGAKATPTAVLVDARGVLRYRGDFERAEARAGDPPPDFVVGDLAFREVKPGEPAWQPPPLREHAREALEAVLAGRDPERAETEPLGCAIVAGP